MKKFVEYMLDKHFLLSVLVIVLVLAVVVGVVGTVVGALFGAIMAVLTCAVGLFLVCATFATIVAVIGVALQEK